MASTYPNDDIVIARTDASTPVAFTAVAPRSSRRQTPAMPMTAPAACAARGRSDRAAQANSIITTGEVAMMVEATLVGSVWAAR
ncbi:hypothetical protein GCM10010486_53020 [Nonomuraea roseoviolacea subsp. carminata]